jgi:hypothetical protein
MTTELLKDKDYDLISVLYHAAQGVDLCQCYVADADKAGDREAAQFFREVGEQNQKLIQRGKALLKERLS